VNINISRLNIYNSKFVYIQCPERKEMSALELL